MPVPRLFGRIQGQGVTAKRFSTSTFLDLSRGPLVREKQISETVYRLLCRFILRVHSKHGERPSARHRRCDVLLNLHSCWSGDLRVSRGWYVVPSSSRRRSWTCLCIRAARPSSRLSTFVLGNPNFRLYPQYPTSLNELFSQEAWRRRNGHCWPFRGLVSSDTGRNGYANAAARLPT